MTRPVCRRAGIILLAAIVFMNAPRAVARTVRQSVGVNIHFMKPKHGEMKTLGDLGAGWIRTDLHWGATERKKGVYDFRRYDKLLARLKAHHMHALLILDYGNPLYGAGGKPPFDDDGRAAFTRWAVAAVAHFQGLRIYWELWNEPNGKWSWPNPNAADYAKLALEADKAIHDRFPNERLIGPACSGVGFKFLEGCFQAGCLQYWDAVSVHAYRQDKPEAAAAKFARLQALIDRYAPSGKSIPIISGEWGYSVSWPGYNEQRQAKFAVREMLFNIQSGIPLSIWYDWHDEGKNNKNGERHFGLTRANYSPKPAYKALRTMLRALGSFTFDRRLPSGRQNDFLLIFKHGSEKRYAVWTATKSTSSVTLRLPPGTYCVVDWLGAKKSVAVGDQGLSITLSGTPQYVEQAG